MSRKKVLVVDDDRVNLTVASRMLSKLGCEVHSAASGEDAIVAARQTTFDLIFMDWMMHPLDGGATTQLIRQDPLNAGTPVIAVTTWDEKQTCLEAGLDDYLQKPVSLRTLEETLARWSSPCANPDCKVV